MKNKPNFLKGISWIWIAIGFIFFVLCYMLIINPFHDRKVLSQVCSQGKCFTVEIADTSAKRENGLMDRTFMSGDYGMLFIFPSSNLYNFRMKDTFIPLDMVWIDEQFRVVRILTAQPCTADPCTVYKPEIGAKYVLEINAGVAAKNKIVEGTMFKFRNIR